MSFNPPVQGHQVLRVAGRHGESLAAPHASRENVTPFADLLANTSKGLSAPRSSIASSVSKRPSNSRPALASPNADLETAGHSDAGTKPAQVRRTDSSPDDKPLAPSIELFASQPIQPTPEQLGTADERCAIEDAIDAAPASDEALQAEGNAGQPGSTEAPGATFQSRTATRLGDILPNQPAPHTAEQQGEAAGSDTPQVPVATAMAPLAGEPARDFSARGSPSDCGGIASAQQLSAMKSAPHSNQFAGAGEQNLPDPNPEQHTAPQAVLASDGEAALPEGVWMAHPPTESHPSLIMFGEVQRSSPASEVAERLLTSISSEVTFMRQMKPDSLAVVLKPDSQTEIFLSLSMTNGELEARARCERGDFHGLNEHWIELQQNLLRQGIKLLPLEEKFRFAHTLSDNTPQADQHTRDGNKQREAPTQDEPLPWTGAVTEPLKKPASRRTQAAHHLLESWA